MKNLNRVVGALLALSLSSTLAWSVGLPSGRFMKFDPLMFRAQVAANHVSVWDSVATSRVGAAGASSVLDTTVAISTEGWDVPAGTVVADSALFAHLIVYDATVGGDCESGADSLGVALQVSADGVTWATTAVITAQTGAAANPIGSRNNQTIANGAFLDLLSANGAALGNGAPIWSYAFKNRPVFSTGLLDNTRIVMFPFIRFILSFHDAKAYIVNAKIGHYMNAAN